MEHASQNLGCRKEVIGRIQMLKIHVLMGAQKIKGLGRGRLRH